MRLPFGQLDGGVVTGKGSSKELSQTQSGSGRGTNTPNQTMWVC